MTSEVTVVGAGLAGSECAYQLAERGVQVHLIEQKPVARTPAQHSDKLAELVCSNSLRGEALVNAVGLLKEEMRRAGSLILAAADRARVPAGGALAVDRDIFSAAITQTIEQHPRIRLERAVVERLPASTPTILATGPLTGEALARDLESALGEGQLAYYDAIAPIITSESIDWDRVFRASRYDKGGDDAYVNCPMDEAIYTAFVQAVLAAEKVPAKNFEEPRYFEGCLPVEVMAERGLQTLAFGPLKPVGLIDPKTQRRPHAVVQLRQENHEGTAFNMVGFQTRMTYPEQKRVFQMIPGLEQAEFERFGSVHRNTFVHAPRVLDDMLTLLQRPGVHLAGQITGVEGYVESAACGFVLGVLLADQLNGRSPVRPPPTTALGALLGHLRRDVPDYQPSNVMWSMFPALENRRLHKRARKEAMAQRGLEDLEAWLDAVGARAIRSKLQPNLPPQPADAVV